MIERVRTYPCTACGRIGPSDPHHVTTVKAGGGDTADNLMPLCRLHHVAWHQMGIGHMVRTFPRVRQWLEFAYRLDILERVERAEKCIQTFTLSVSA